MPRKLEADRTLFLSTLALCLIGAVMVFSASAVTAREQFGSAYYFLWRQIIWLAVGIGAMFAGMNFDYRRLRQPRVVFALLSAVMMALIGL
jgi:cell division protein FtsW